MIIGLVGLIGSGKGTVSDILVNRGYETDSFAAPLKDLCSSIFGWERYLMEGDTATSREFRETPDIFWSRKLDIPNFTPRLAMQLIGTDVMRKNFDQDIWLNSLEYRFYKQGGNTNKVISDARFQNELELIQNMGGKVIWVQRGELPDWYDKACQANEGSVLAEKIMKTRYGDVHRSEWDWAGFPVNHIIQNNGTMEDLEREVDHALASLDKKAFRIV